MRRHSQGQATGLLTGILAGVLSLFAQTSGRLTGTVVDPSGGVIPTAQVTITNEATGAQYSSETNAQGTFLVPELESGRYTVRVAAAGFRPTEVRGVKVDVGKEYSLPPIRLEVGGVQETVTVSAGIDLVQTTSSENTATLYTEQIRSLPLANREPMTLISLQPGAASNGRTATTLNGTRTSFTTLTIDGINVQDNFIRSNALNFIPNLPFLSQVSEFTITTSNANVAAAGSSQVAFSTPSGTNNLHAELFWQNRTSATAANSFFNNASGIPRPFFLLNQFGGSLGGPLRRNELFFYGYYEGYRSKDRVERTGVVLRPEARDGLFAYRDLSGRVRQVNVLTLAGVSMDPRVRSLLERVPATVNFPAVGDGLNTSGFRFLQRDNRTRDNTGLRLDYLAREQHNFSGTFSWNRDIVDRPDLDVTFSPAPKVFNDDTTKLLSLTWRWTPLAVLTNELRSGFNLAPGVFRTTEDFSNPPLLIGFLFNNPVNKFQRQGRNTNTFSLLDNASWQRGAHAFRFGWQSQWIRVESFDEAGILPTYAIGISATNVRGLQTFHFPGGISAADLTGANSLLASLAGFVSSGSQVFNVTSRTSGYVPGAGNVRHLSLNNSAFYGADQWRIRRNLTLNYGLRWEYLGRYDERDSLLLLPVIEQGNVIQTLLSNATVDFAGAGVGRPVYDQDLNNFGPNLGLAWDPRGDGKSAIRLGYSISYVNDESILAPDNAAFANAGLSTTASLANLAHTISSGLPAIPVPAFRVPRKFSDQLEINPTAAGFAVHPKLVAPYVQQWTVSLQRELPAQIGLELRYVGNKGTKLYRGIDYNQVLIRPNGFLDDFRRARTNGFLALARTGTFDPAFNAAIPGSQPLTVFPNLLFGGVLTSSLVRTRIQQGEVGELAALYFANGLEGTVPLVPNPNIFVADLLTNLSHSTYHALQVEAKHALRRGLFLQANYTWSKVLTDAPGTSQVRFDPYLDIAQPHLERARADYDLPHAFKANFIYALPLGSGHRLAARNRLLNGFLSGWRISSIFIWQSGAPFSILSGRGTLNRAARSGENTATSPLPTEAIQGLLGVFKTGDAVYYIHPSVIGEDGRAVPPDGEAPFPGQVFFNPSPGEVGTLQRRLFNGPTLFDWDFAVLKETRLAERANLELRLEFFTFLNHPVFFSGDHNINSPNFGKLGTTLTSPRFLQTSLRLTF